MTDNCYFFNLLNSKEAIAYNNVLNCFKNHQQSCESPLIDNHQFRKIYESVIYDHPEFYYISSRFQGGETYKGLSKIFVMKFQELYGPKEQFKIDSSISKILNDIQRLCRGKSELEMYMFALDYLIENVQYEIDNTYNQNAASALYFHKAQCSGISAAYKLICDKLGLFCIIAASSSNQNGSMIPHAWNIVKLGNNYYHVDSTYVVGHNKVGKKPYSYELAFYSDNSFREHHILQRHWPKCNDDSLERLNVSKNGQTTLTKEITSFYDLRTFLSEQIKSGNKSIMFYSKIDVPSSSFETSLINSLKMVCMNLGVTLTKAGYSKRGDTVTLDIDY